MANLSDYGAYVPTTNIFDIENLENIDINSPEFVNFLVRVRQSLNNIAILLNAKDTGIYPLTEFICGQLYFPDETLNSTTPKMPTYRSVYRKVISFGTLPNTGTTTVAHGITSLSTNGITFTRIRGESKDPTSGTQIPLPYPSPVLANNIELFVDNTNISITTGSNRSAFTNTQIILEYLKE